MNLIPLPHHILVQEGVFSIVHDTAIVLDVAQDDIDFETAKILQQKIEKYIAMTLPIKKGVQGEEIFDFNCICFAYDETDPTNKTDQEREAYELIVTPHKITISACSNRGFLYGASTLIQLCKTSHGEIGCMKITDSPSYPNRGYMLDVSRGRVPTMDILKALVDKLSLYKINQLQLYMENGLRLDGFGEIWSQTDAFKPEEILELDRYCAMRCIELVPCIATFGHLYDLLRSVSFGKFREVDPPKEEVFTWHNRMRYHTINVSDPESFTLITGILNQYISLFRSTKINICCDETFELGKGKSADLLKNMAPGKLYLSYVNKLVEYLQDKGKSVMIWGDIMQKNHELIGELNPQVTCLNWYYDYGAKEEIVKNFSDNGLKQYVCPSVSGYSRLVNDYDMSFTNINEMAELGHQYQAEGFLNTDWGDCGHINMPALAIPCLIYGAAQCWNAQDRRDFKTIDQIISLVEYRDQNKNIVGLLRELSHQDLVTFNDLVFFRDYKVYNQIYNESGILMHEKAKDKMMKVSETELKTAVTKCEEIIISLKQNDSTSHADLRQEMLEYYLSARGVALMQRLALVLKQKEFGQEVTPLNTPYELASKLECWLMDYCEDWRVVSRESELYRIKEFIWQICAILRKY